MSRNIKYKTKQEALNAVRKDGLNIRYVDFPLRNDEDILYQAVIRNGMAIAFGPESCRNKFKYAYAAVKSNGASLYFFPKYQDDELICSIAVQQNGRANDFVGKDYTILMPMSYPTYPYGYASMDDTNNLERYYGVLHDGQSCWGRARVIDDKTEKCEIAIFQGDKLKVVMQKEGLTRAANVMQEYIDEHYPDVVETLRDFYYDKDFGEYNPDVYEDEAYQDNHPELWDKFDAERKQEIIKREQGYKKEAQTQKLIDKYGLDVVNNPLAQKHIEDGTFKDGGFSEEKAFELENEER